jgi:hypothetical protein
VEPRQKRLCLPLGLFGSSWILKVSVSLAQFIEAFIYVGGLPFRGECGFEYWPFLVDIYNEKSKEIILKCSRQCSKSTTLGNMMLTYCCLVPGFRALYIAPRQEQVGAFSNDRLKDVVNSSPILKKMATGKEVTKKVTERSFINGSMIRLRAAFISPGAARGLPSRKIAIDEIQDINPEFIPVIFECSATYPTDKIHLLSGTPSSMDNGIEFYWTHSTMNEWMVKCPSCGKWNGVREKNIGLHWYICANCSSHLDVRTGQWVEGKIKADRVGFHINQLMTPYTYKDWGEFVAKCRRYPRPQFMNEVLGESWESGVRPVTRDEILKLCSTHSITPHPHPSIAQKINVAGIDWGTGEHAFTVLIIFNIEAATGKYKILYAKRFSGTDAVQDEMLKQIIKTLNLYNCTKVGADHGFGHYYNYHLQKNLTNGINRVVPICYAETGKKVMSWDKTARHLNVSRSQIIENVFQLIKQQEYIFPKAEEWMDPFGEDILAEFIEERPKLNKLVYSHPADKPDDALHALTYATIAAQFIKPRQEIFRILSTASDELLSRRG